MDIAVSLLSEFEPGFLEIAEKEIKKAADQISSFASAFAWLRRDKQLRRRGRKWDCRRSNSRYRGASQSAAKFGGIVTQGGALTDSRFALGYYLSPFSGLSVSDGAEKVLEFVCRRCECGSNGKGCFSGGSFLKWRPACR